MCPNCTRGLTEKKEVCEICGGTGFIADVQPAEEQKPSRAPKMIRKGRK